MRKTIATVLTAAMVMGVGFLAFAEDGNNFENLSSEDVYQYLLDRGVAGDKLDLLNDEILESTMRQAEANDFTDTQVQQYIDGQISIVTAPQTISHEKGVLSEDGSTFITSHGEYPNLLQRYKSQYAGENTDQVVPDDAKVIPALTYVIGIDENGDLCSQYLENEETREAEANIENSADNIVVMSEPVQQDDSETTVTQEETIKTAAGTNTQYWSSYDVQFTFTAGAVVTYRNDLGRYVISNITLSRPSVSTRNGANATITMPIYTMIDGGRHAYIKATATIQNSTGYSVDKTVTMYLMANSSGNLVLTENA